MSPATPDELELIEVGSPQHGRVHDYAFGIISSDLKGRATMVSISEPYKKLSSGSLPEGDEDLLNTVGFQSWSMSRYQSLYHSTTSSLNEDDENGEEDEFREQNNNANNTSVSEAIPISGDRRVQIQPLKSSSSGSNLRLSQSSSPPKKSTSSLPRRWSTNSFFGYKASPPQVRFLPVDPDMPPPTPEVESWISTITHIPDKIRQHRADKNRFNVKSVPRDKLKKLECY